MTTTPLTAADCLRLLAEAEEPCPLCKRMQERDGAFHVGDMVGCAVCHQSGPWTAGSGRVPRFRDAQGQAVFRKKCQENHLKTSVQGTSSATWGPVPCYEVGCRGWLSLDKSDIHLETILEAQGGHIDLMKARESEESSEFVWTCFFPHPKGWIGLMDTRARGEGTSSTEAALRALVAVVQKEAA